MQANQLLQDQSSWDPHSPPLWMWYTARQRDLTALRIEGIVATPHIWLGSTKQTAIEFNPSPDRLILRVSTAALDVSKLRRDPTWQLWAEAFEAGSPSIPPTDLIKWWARLKKSSDPDSSGRLESVVATGEFDLHSLRADLGSQLRIKQDTVWTYQDPVSPDALSLVDRGGYYVSIDSFPLVRRKRL